MPELISVFAGSFGRIALAAKSQPVAEHAHPHMHLLFKVDGADRAVEIAGRTYRMTDTQAVAVNPWQPHGEPGPIMGASTILTCYIRHEWLGERFADLSLRQFEDGQQSVTAAMRQIIAVIAECMAGGEANGRPDLESALTELVGLALGQSSATLPPSRSAIDFRIRRAIDMIRSDPAHPRNLGVLANQVGLSRSRFFTQFQQATGVSPRLYANAVWLERAVDALLIHGRPIGEVSESLGFATHSHFCRFFREKIGFTPREFQAAASRAAAPLSRAS